MEEKNLSLYKIAIPIFFEIMLFMLLGVADTLMLSRYGTSEVSQIAVDSVAMSNQIIGNVNILFSFISAGTAVLIAQNIGAKNFTEVKRVTVVSLAINLLVGITFSVLMRVYGNAVLSLLGMEGVRLAKATSYLKIVGGFMMVQALLTTSSAVIRSHGKTSVTLRITIGMNVLNVIGDAIFIFGLFGAPKLGVEGVAIATTISRLLAFVVMMVYIFKHYVKVEDIRAYIHKPWKTIMTLLKIGVPTAMQDMSYNLTQMVLAWMILNYMNDVSFTTRIFSWQISWFVLLSAISIGQATQIMIGQYAGARRFDLAQKVCISNFRLSFGLAVILGAVIFIFGEEIISIYTVNPEIIKLGGAVLMVDAFLEPGRTFNLVIIGGLKGAGDVVFPVVNAIIFMWLLSVGLSYYLAVVLGWGLPAVWIGMGVDEWVRGLINYGRWKSGKWKTKVLAEKVQA